MRKIEWSLSDVNSLPPGEHDYFDRKSGRLLEDQRFRKGLAKALSGILNSGGGHIVLGVADDGEFDGVTKLKGRTCVREWMEQIIPTLVEPTPVKFKVHLLESTSEYQIPDDRVVIVIDLEDSHLAPFQSREDKIYYHRVGGHSVPAPHFYLDTLSKRQFSPVLRAELLNARVISATETKSQLFTQVLLEFEIENDGNVTPRFWHINLRYNGELVSNKGSVRRSGFPVVSFDRKGQRISESPILPGQQHRTVLQIGLSALKSDFPEQDLPEALHALFTTDNELSACVVSESHCGDWVPVEMSLLHNIVTPNEIRRFVPEIESATEDGSIGGGINSYRFYLEGKNQPEDHVKFNGIIENASEELFKQFNVVLVFYDKNDNPVGLTTSEIGYLPPATKRHWSGWILAAKIWTAEYAKIYYYDESWFSPSN